MATLRERLKEQREQDLFRNYVSRVLRNTSENVAKLAQGSYMAVDYDDIINPKPEEKRSSDEIITGIKKKIEKINS